MPKVAFLWHMHQPYYRDPSTEKMTLPWVRLHSLKDYYDLPARVGKFERLKMTFNLVPSLLEQIDLYVEKKTIDRHLELTQKPVDQLDRTEKAEIFDTFFNANFRRMIEPFPRYRYLLKKLQDCGMDTDLAARTASPQELLDLTVWSNLVWIDPIFRTQQPFKKLFEKGDKFSVEDRIELIEGEYKIMSEIIPLYRSLVDEGKIEVSFSPFFHPILPLLCDTESARESMPDITLPTKRFCHPEDAEKQVAASVAMYREKFGGQLQGMWPSEGSISEPVADILIDQGIKWMASDEEVLFGSLAKGGQNIGEAALYHSYKIDRGAGSINLFFRDHALSDRIGFVYSGWDEEKAVDDFIDQLHRLDDKIGRGSSDAVVPIILDGENCWEYYQNDGDRFLNLLFEKLESDPLIETVTFGQAVSETTPRELKRIKAGSWINHNFRIWIGHSEDNGAWDLLWEARQALTQFKKKNPGFERSKIAQAEKSILIAEGSDWNWWYGDEHRGAQNEIFDLIYRNYLISVYSVLGLEIPRKLLRPILSVAPEESIMEPDGTVTPIIDGRLTHYYEWLGSGILYCLDKGGAMHRVARALDRVYFVSDDEYIYLRVDFTRKRFLVENRKAQLKIDLLSPGNGEFVFDHGGVVSFPDWAGNKSDILYACDDIVEIGLKKTIFFPDGSGEIFFKVSLIEDGEKVESWPQGDPLRFKFSGEGEEIVWDL